MIREGLINEMIKGLSRTYKVSQKHFKSQITYLEAIESTDIGIS